MSNTSERVEFNSIYEDWAIFVVKRIVSPSEAFVNAVRSASSVATS